MYNQYREGWIEVICGCMFAGKTEELIRRINVLSYARKNILVFKPKIDDRDEDVVDICEYLADSGLRVMVAGLDKDFRGEPFGVLPDLLTRAEFVTKLTAVCAKCGAPATRTHRIINGKPASSRGS